MSERRSPLAPAIDDLWERRAELSPADSAARAEVVAAVDELDAGRARVAFVDPRTDDVVVDERAKRAILLAFRLLPMVQSQVGDFRQHDRVPAWSVCVVGGTRMRTFAGGEFGLPCLLMLRRLPAGSRPDKSELNAILRDHGVNG
jgi:hypothetical protein